MSFRWPILEELNAQNATINTVTGELNIMGTNRKYWKGLDELNQTPEFLESVNREFPKELSVDEFLADSKLAKTETGRRDFLKFLGFSVAAVTVASCEAPVVKSIPYVVKPEDITPGVANWYASTYYDGSSYAGILVKTREGRPIYVKGNADFGVCKGGTNPQIIASVLSLYDSDRLTGPTIDGEEVTWGKVDKQIKSKLNSLKGGDKQIVLLTNSVISPSFLGLISEFKAKYGSATVSVLGDNPVPPPVEVPAEGAVAEMPVVPEGTVRHIQYDAISYNGMREANKACFGQRIIPDYDFSRANTIVSVGADFLNNWIFSTQFVGQYLTNRNPDLPMARLHQFESNMSLTGSNADVRVMIKPSEQGKVIALMHKEITGNAVPGVKTDGLSDDVVSRAKTAAKELKENGGRSLLISGSNRKSVQVIVNSINQALGNYNTVINLNNPIALHQSEDAKVESLIVDMNKGKVGAIFILGTNPVYSLSKSAEFKTGLEKVGLRVSLSSYADETAAMCTYVCPDSHALESWNDYSPKMSHYSLAQPTIMPVHNTRQAGESLMKWSGKGGCCKGSCKGQESIAYYKYIRKMWKQYGFPMQTDFTEFSDYWNTKVHNSCGDIPVPAATTWPFNGDLSAAGEDISKISGGTWEIALYQKVAIGSGQQAGNPWLQEMPDPVSKVTWDNYITMHPDDMDAGNYSKDIGQERPANVATVSIEGVSFDLPVYPQPGQTPGTVGIALGYGRGENGEKIGKGAFHCKQYGEWEEGPNGGRKMIGQNAFKLAKGEFDVYSAEISKTAEEYLLACTQTHATVMGRNSIIRETTADIYATADKSAYNPAHVLHSGWNHEEKHISEYDLWNAHPVENAGHRWGMSIDLNTCIGCGSCLIACQSENNVPVVGKDEVRRSREMHWLRIDRYYASDLEPAPGTRDKGMFAEQGFGALEIPADNPKVVFMPMLCQHCNHAPCETVCPVAATTHSNEGLNQMAYNRCIGTRYCANNCPYKVRRFNWFNYPSYRKFTNINPAQDDLGRMVLNPDVVVRTRGVMEKCSFCVQRVQAGKLVAKKEDRPVVDGDVVTACADACPANAIIFGDWNDVESKIRKSSQEKRAYQALEEVGVKPNIWYKVKVRNEENPELEAIQLSGAHGEEHAEAPAEENGTEGGGH